MQFRPRKVHVRSLIAQEEDMEEQHGEELVQVASSGEWDVPATAMAMDPADAPATTTDDCGGVSHAALAAMVDSIWNIAPGSERAGTAARSAAGPRHPGHPGNKPASGGSRCLARRLPRDRADTIGCPVQPLEHPRGLCLPASADLWAGGAADEQPAPFTLPLCLRVVSTRAMSDVQLAQIFAPPGSVFCRQSTAELDRVKTAEDLLSLPSCDLLITKELRVGNRMQTWFAALSTASRPDDLVVAAAAGAIWNLEIRVQVPRCNAGSSLFLQREFEQSLFFDSQAFENVRTATALPPWRSALTSQLLFRIRGALQTEGGIAEESKPLEGLSAGLLVEMQFPVDAALVSVSLAGVGPELEFS